MRLVQNGQLALTDRVFGQGSRLGTTYGSKPYANADKQITLDHLLTHTSGYENTPNDPMFQEPARDHSSLIGWVLDNRNPTKTPGADYHYLNFGYCLIGRIIEKVTAQSYANYVTRAILAPAGIASMQLAGDTLAARATDEVVYYGQSGDDPYGMKVARMDAHGGWIATSIDLLRFLRVVDGRATPADLLSASTILTMTTGTTTKPTYARGWAVDGSGNWDHNGALPGTLSLLRRRANGVGHAALVNTRKPPPAQDGMLAAFYKMMDDVTAKLGPLAPFDLFG
jgi:CubicO group peptidase (beta-lactamase class C family)